MNVTLLTLLFGRAWAALLRLALYHVIMLMIFHHSFNESSKRLNTKTRVDLLCADKRSAHMVNFDVIIPIPPLRRVINSS